MLLFTIAVELIDYDTNADDTIIVLIKLTIMIMISNIIITAYPQDYYSNMMHSAWQMWTDYQKESGETVYTHTRELAIGQKDTTDIWKLIESCKTNNLQHSILSASEAMKLHPGLDLPDDYIAVLQEDAGILHATKSVMMMQSLAKKEGAKFFENEEVLDIIPNTSDSTVTIKTSKGKIITADKVVVTAGAWTRKLIETISPEYSSVHLDPTHITVAYWPIKSPGMYKAKDKWPVLIDYSVCLYLFFEPRDFPPKLFVTQ